MGWTRRPIARPPVSRWRSDKYTFHRSCAFLAHRLLHTFHFAPTPPTTAKNTRDISSAFLFIYSLFCSDNLGAGVRNRWVGGRDVGPPGADAGATERGLGLVELRRRRPRVHPRGALAEGRRGPRPHGTRGRQPNQVNKELEMQGTPRPGKPRRHSLAPTSNLYISMSSLLESNVFISSLSCHFLVRPQPISFF